MLKQCCLCQYHLNYLLSRYVVVVLMQINTGMRICCCVVVCYICISSCMSAHFACLFVSISDFVGLSYYCYTILICPCTCSVLFNYSYALLYCWFVCLYLLCLNNNKKFLLRRSQDEALRTGVPVGLLVVAVGTGCSGRAGQGRDSLSSLGSGMLPMPVEALPTEWFLLWLNSDMLEEREWLVLYPERSRQRFYNINA